MLRCVKLFPIYRSSGLSESCCFPCRIPEIVSAGSRPEALNDGAFPPYLSDVGRGQARFGAVAVPHVYLRE